MVRSSLIASAAGAALLLAVPAGAQEVRMNMASSFPSTQPILGSSGPKVAETITKVSGGDIQVRFFEPGALVPAFEVLDAVGSGVAQAAWTMPGYHTAKDIAYALFSSVPFGPGSSEYLGWMLYGGGADLMNERLHSQYNVHSEICGVSPPETAGWYRNEINSVEDLQGMRMRFFGLGARVMQSLGVDTQLLPGGEIYAALERGTIDAAEFSFPVVDESAGFYQVAQYNYFPGWHQQATLHELIINLDTWNAMTEGQQALIQTVCRGNITDMIAESEAVNSAALVRLEERGVQIRDFDPAIIATFEEHWEKVVEELKAESAVFAEAWEALSEFRESYRVWGERAYLR